LNVAHIKKIALGTVQFGMNYGISNKIGQTPELEVAKILQLASNYEIDLLDTATNYGNSEIILGRIISGQFKIISKFPKPEGKDLSEYLDQSLGRLNTNTLYGYIAHDADGLINNPEIWNELISLKKKILPV